MARTSRNANVELLRIVCMLMIVAHHYAAFGFYAEELAFSRNKIFVDIFGMAGHVRLACSVDEAIIARSADGFKRAVAACHA